MTETLLELENVTKQFGAFTAIDDVSLSIERNRLQALIGPNGAGKTTLYNILSGKLSPTSGRIRFEGEDITGRSSAERTRRGIGRSFQVTNVFDGITVRKNVRGPVVARNKARLDPFGRIDEYDEINAEVDRILEMVGIADIADEVCSSLAYGQRRRVELGVTLATDPKLVLLDEPTAGMTPSETTDMVQLIESLYADSDVTFLLTEHDMDVVLSSASRIIVLSNGRIIADETPEEIQENERVQREYLGGSTV